MAAGGKALLDFEKPIADLVSKIEELKAMAKGGQLDLSQEIKMMEERLTNLRKEIFANLSAVQVVQISRHLQRPTTLDYIALIFENFTELFGDRCFGDDPALVGGPAKLDGGPVMLIGHQKGKTTKENLTRNFGMTNPEGYRKALRLMKLAEKFNRPIIALVDTPGAYPGIGAEERGIAESIAKNLREMAGLKVPFIVVITGQGGSGGALGIGMGNRVLMLEYSIYSVITPEGCASILFRDAGRAAEAAEALKLTAKDLLNLGVIDEIIKEPVGGAHNDHETTAKNIKLAILKHLTEIKKLTPEQLILDRYNKYRKMGQFFE